MSVEGVRVLLYNQGFVERAPPAHFNSFQSTLPASLLETSLSAKALTH